MRILLIPPTHHYAGEYPSLLSASDFPAGFGYLAAALKQAGHEVFGCNPNNIIGYVNAQTMITDVITKKIREANPDLIGLGGLCTDYAFLRDAIAVIRKENPKIPIVLGGQIVTNDAEFIFEDLKPDYAVTGEGEKAVVEIANSCSNQVIPAPMIWHGEYSQDLDKVPFPDYDPFDIKGMVDHYSMATRLLYRYSRPNARPYNIVASRSCPFTCTFCIHGRRDAPYRARSIPNVMAEIKESYEKYKFNVVILLDELFAVKNDRLKDFSNAVLEGREKYGWDFDWMFQTHASARFDLDTLKLARKAGCFFFSYGLESASPTVLKSMNKKIVPEQITEVMNLAREAKIGFGGNLIFGDPAETAETVAESLGFWFSNCHDNFVFLGELMPYPGSKVFDTYYGDMTFQQKHDYYTNIDKVVPNMSKISASEFEGLRKLIPFIEKSWLFVRTTPALSVEQDRAYDPYLRSMGGFYYNITTKCPYCGEEVKYRERLNSIRESFWLGTGCTNCNRKIKVEYTPK